VFIRGVGRRVGFEHYYTKKPTSALRFYELKVKLRGFSVVMQTSSGVFSPKKVDNASRLLIENMKVSSGERFLDLGCGYGVVGIIAAKLGALVTLSDVNERAVMLAKKNIKRNKVKGVVVQSDSFSNIKSNFNNIVLNPPLAAGMRVCKRLIEDSYHHLRSGGLFQLVARHKKGGSRLEDYMEELFGNVKTIARKGGFRVYVSEKI
jgi:16S rRNA G1207 methylase RsmC